MKKIFLGVCLLGASLSVGAADLKALSKVSTLTAEAAAVAAHAALKDC